MLDIPAELLLMISTHMDCHDPWALVVTSQSIGYLLLPEYLHCYSLVLKDACAGGLSVELCDLARYVSLGFWSAIHIFQLPEKMYCLIPCRV